MPTEFAFIVGSEADLVNRIRRALGLITCYGGVDGEHHKQWVLDQVVHILTGEPGEYPANPRGYNKWLAVYDGDSERDKWSNGIAP